MARSAYSVTKFAGLSEILLQLCRWTFGVLLLSVNGEGYAEPSAFH